MNKQIYNLDYIIRYSNVPRIKDETVAAPSFFVAMEVYQLREKYVFNLDKAIHIALCHDLPETYIDDVNHKIKAEYPKVAKALKKAETKMTKKFSPLLQKYIAAYDDGSIEAIFVHFADVLQCKTYSKHEIDLGNKGYMLKVYKDSKYRIKQFKKVLKKYRISCLQDTNN